ncbi:MAG: hypothetical protein PHF86_12190, partial [Candidatus Nanoarchaeia archaeon]|nr:hypothetical protein [Candidatus Nanoarchaeia archaeon]
LFSEYIKLADKYGYPKFEFVKRHALNFSKGIRNSVKLRTNICRVKDIEELKKDVLDFQKTVN